MSKEHPILAQDYTAKQLGIRVEELGAGKATISMTIAQDMLNGFGIAHGGMIFTLADTAFALACNDPEQEGKTITVASGADINFISSPLLGQTIVAHACHRSSAGRSGIYDVTVTNQVGETIAEFRGRSRTIKPKNSH